MAMWCHGLLILFSGLIITGDPSNPQPQTHQAPAATSTRALSRDEQTLLEEASLAFSEGNYAKCLEILSVQAASSSAHPEILNLRGAVLCESGKFKEALPFFEWAAESDPRHFWAHYNLAECTLMLGDEERARGLFLLAPTASRSQKDLVALKLMLLDLRQGNLPSARTRLPNWPPDSAAGYAAYFAIAQSEGDTEAAKNLQREGKTLFPSEWGAFLKKTLRESGISAE